MKINHRKQPTQKAGFRRVLAQFVDSEGAHCSVGAEAA